MSEAPKKKKPSSLQVIAAALLAIATGYIVFLNWGPLRRTLVEADLFWVVAGIVLHLFNYYLRALRLRILSGEKFAAWPDGFRIIGTHGIITYLLPLRAGELALPAILHSRLGVSWGDGLRLLLWVRMMDICALGIWVLLAAAFLDVVVPSAFMWAWVLAGFAMAFSPAIVNIMIGAGKNLPSAISKYLRKLKSDERVSFKIIAVSLGVWAMTGVSLYCLARAVAMPLGMGDIWFVVTVQLPLQLAPIQGIANSGNHEIGWVAALTILGLDATASLNFALATHALHICYIAVIGSLLVLMKVFLDRK